MPARARTEIQFSRAPRIRLLLSKRLNRRTIPWSWNVLSYIRRMMQKFLTFRASPIVPLGRLPDEILRTAVPRFKRAFKTHKCCF